MMLLEKINKELGDEKLEDLRFQLDSRIEAEEKGGQVQQPPKSFRPLDARRVETFDRIVAGLEDEELKKALKKVWVGFEGIRDRDR